MLEKETGNSRESNSLQLWIKHISRKVINQYFKQWQNGTDLPGHLEEHPSSTKSIGVLLLSAVKAGLDPPVRNDLTAEIM